MKNIKDSDKYMGYKVRLFPTKEQEHLFYEYFGMNRFVYNLCIDLQEEHYEKYKNNEEEYKRLSYEKLNVKITSLKHEKYKWLSKYNAESIKSAIRDCVNAYKRYDNGQNNIPSYKNKNTSKKQFSIRADRMTILNNYITFSSIGNIKYCNSYGENILGCSNKDKKNIKYLHYSNPRISFDGLYFYLSFTIPKDQDHTVNSYTRFAGNTEWQEQESSEAIGIDVGLRNEKWMVDSTNTRIERPNSDALNKKISRLQRKYDRQKNMNLKKNSSFMEQHPNGSKNMQKTRAKIDKCYKKITNRRRNVVHEYACSLLQKKPKAIVMESINVHDIENSYLKTAKNKNKICKMTRDAALYDTMIIIERKMINNGIPVIRADSNYPSSQICSCCGYRHNIGRAKYYRCPICGAVIDRDLNAAINLSRLAY